MSLLEFKERFMRVLPGRIRMEVYGLKNNRTIAEYMIACLGSLEGVRSVEASAETGRVLVGYDSKMIPLQDICEIIRMVEEHVVKDQIRETESIRTEHKHATEPLKQDQEAAATIEASEPASEPYSGPIRYAYSETIPPGFTAVPVMTKEKRKADAVPIPLLLSVGGLGALGIKQLLSGKSAVARSAGAFYASALVSVITGYPFLKRGFQQFSEKRKWNVDLLMGASALALGLLRENLVVLAGLSILQYVNWKRMKLSLDPTNQDNSPMTSPEIRQYSERMGKLGILLGGTAFLLTRNPLYGLGILLAANPRPSTVTEEFSWKQAELVSKEHGLFVPKNGSLLQLARTKTILFEDTAQIVTQEANELQCVTNQNEKKIWYYANVLMTNSNHPWKEEVKEQAKHTKQKKPTVSCVEISQYGIKGNVDGTEVLIGTKLFLQSNGVIFHEYDLKAKRLEKQGYSIQFVAANNACIGVLAKQDEVVTSEFSIVKETLPQDWNIGVLSNVQHVKKETLAKLGVDHSWTDSIDQVVDRIRTLRQRGEEVLLITSATEQTGLRLGVPSVSSREVQDALSTLEYANQIQGIARQNFMFTKLWNKIGLALSIPLFVTAPIINIMADALTLVLVSRTKQVSEQILRQKEASTVSLAAQEAAAAVDPTADPLDSPPWHALPGEEIMAHFQVHEQAGLASEQALMIRTHYGLNQLESKQTSPWFVSFLGQFKEFTPLILLGASALAIATGGLVDGLIMAGVLLANAALGTTQERKAEKIVDSLGQFNPPTCKVIRDGKELELSSVDLVPGDLVSVEAGDRVPADIRLIRTWNLEINEAPLTGESLPVQKTDQSVEEHCPLSDRKNMLYMGTDVTRGKGLGIVVATGRRTEMGHLMSLMKGEIKELTPLQKKVTSVGKAFVKGAMIAGGIVFLTGLLRGVSITQMIMTTITLVASAVPEGLPVTITIALSAGIFRMARRNALIRKLSALETLGRTTVICSDKTGTLTKNEMTVKAIASVNRTWMVTGDGYEPHGSIEELVSDEVSATAETIKKTEVTSICNNPELLQIAKISLLCNNSQLEQRENKWLVKGDPTEGALLTLAAKTGMGMERMGHWTRCHEIPFDSDTGTMSVVCQDTQTDSDCYVFLKGSVEAVLGRCSWYQEEGNCYPLTDDKKEMILKQNEAFAAEALRVLGFAYGSIDWKQEECDVDSKDLIYVGLVGMLDPPKPDIEKSIREAFELGVRPVMITGDHPITAVAIAKQLGIWDGEKKVLIGTELDRLSDQELTDLVEDVAIFARVTPEHKLRIVTAFQNRGHIVAMTGDGVNDTPAIKKANVGIAMGQMGTEVTKETADMVLKEDHFGSIVEGVKEGRTIIGNIRKAIGCLLTGNLAEILVTSVAVIAGMPIPLVPIQIMLMNLLTDALPAMVLAVNPGNKTKETKRQDIVDKSLYQKVITRGVLLGAGSLGLFAITLSAGAPIAVAQTVAFTTLVVGQLVQIFSWRQEGTTGTVKNWTQDRYLLGAIGVSSLALLSVLYIPPIARIFHATPLSIGHWAMILAAAGAVHILSKPIQYWLDNSRNDSTKPPVLWRRSPVAMVIGK